MSMIIPLRIIGEISPVSEKNKKIQKGTNATIIIKTQAEPFLSSDLTNDCSSSSISDLILFIASSVAVLSVPR